MDARNTGTWDIWLMELKTGVLSKLTVDPRSERDPIWSPDGQRIAYVSDRNGKIDVSVKELSGGKETPLAETDNVIVDAVRVALERTPPELSADIVDRGLVITGGGSMLKNLDKRLREETGLPVSNAEDPLSSVVLGAGKMLGDFDLLRKIAID